MALPASIAQERLWKLQQALPGLPFFNVLHALRLTSAFDTAILERSLDEIVRRHEILRTTFAVVDGRYVQVIAPQLDRAPALRRSARVAGVQEGRPSGTKIIQEEAASLLSTSREVPLLRARLVRLAEREHLLLITMHQVIVDGWSLGVLVDELAALTMPSPPGGRRPWHRFRFNTRTLRTGSGTGGHIPTSSRSLNTGASSCAIRCP